MNAPVSLTSPYEFSVPRELEASSPPEARGLARDDVAMLVAHRSDRRLITTSFRLLASFLVPGDLLVINTSGTIPAAFDAIAPDGTEVVVHLSTQLDQHRWTLELREKNGTATRRWASPVSFSTLAMRGGASLSLCEPYLDEGRLWVADVDLGDDPLAWLWHFARAIHYDYVERDWPIEMYQNVYATEFASAEMASAGRPFTKALLTSLVASGVGVVPIVLHTGVASLESGETPYPERVRVPVSSAERVNATRRANGRVIAVGTTVVRALESSVDERGKVRAYDGWTDLVVTPERGVTVVDGVLTGWHEPVSSHLSMLEAIAGRALLVDSYREALERGLRWHEFGDLHLILP